AITNTGEGPRRIAVTSYGEVVLAEHGGDVRHPSFGGMFVESSFDPDAGALLFRRRPRSASETPLYLLHALVSRDPLDEPIEYEGNRRSFIGRGGDLRAPAGLRRDALAAEVGATLDPVYALRARLELRPHRTASVAVISVMGTSRREVLATAQRYGSWQALRQVLGESRVVQARQLLRQGIDPDDLPATQELLSRLLYPARSARAPAGLLAANRLGQRSLWAHGISGDHPILLVRVASSGDLDAVRVALAGHKRWREQGFT